MEPLRATQLTERIREFLHVVHAYRRDEDLKEVIRIVEKPGCEPSEAELNQMVKTAEALCSHLDAIRALTKDLIEDARALQRRMYGHGGPAPQE